ncbi:lysozyme inhibitor LprI family protein [Pseudomonas nicosulfuronedens]
MKRIDNRLLRVCVFLCFFVSFNSIYSIASPEVRDYSKEYDLCLSKTPQLDNLAIHLCAERISVAVNKKITVALGYLRKVYAEIAPQDIDKLDKSQENWVVYRNSQCELAGNHIGSPMLSLCPMQKIFNA